jgi:phosphoglucosamine mutase
MGIALDGDADRVILIDDKGQVVDGDKILAICAGSMVQSNRLRKKTVVATVMSNLGLEHALQRLDARLLRTQVGDRYVVEAMRQGGYNLGGEQSGHVIFLDQATTGDGMLAALQVLGVMLRTGRPFSELAARCMDRVPQVLESVTLSARRPLEDMARLSSLTSQVAGELGDQGRVIVRWSGTEPKLRVMIEGPQEDRIRAWAMDLVDAARRDVE